MSWISNSCKSTTIWALGQKDEIKGETENLLFHFVPVINYVAASVVPVWRKLLFLSKRSLEISHLYSCHAECIVPSSATLKIMLDRFVYNFNPQFVRKDCIEFITDKSVIITLTKKDIRLVIKWDVITRTMKSRFENFHWRKSYINGKRMFHGYKRKLEDLLFSEAFYFTLLALLDKGLKPTEIHAIFRDHPAETMSIRHLEIRIFQASVSYFFTVLMRVKYIWKCNWSAHYCVGIMEFRIRYPDKSAQEKKAEHSLHDWKLLVSTYYVFTKKHVQ